MGISNLLRELKSIMKDGHISDLRGLRVAVDGHCWLHRAAYNCSRDLAVNPEGTIKYVDFFKSMITLLRSHGVEDILFVFDGGPLPAKSGVSDERGKNRQDHLQQGLDAEASGNYQLAEHCYRQSVSISPLMIKRTIETLKSMNVPFIVSPYESDAQLTFLSLNDYVDCVITEDSDLVVYGCRRIIFKLDREGQFVELQRSELGNNQGMSFLNWSNNQFKLFCCLSGCDYLKNLPNIGIVKAYKLVDKFKTLPALAAELRTKYPGSGSGPSSSSSIVSGASSSASTARSTTSSSTVSASTVSASASVNIDQYLHDLELALAMFSHQTVFNPLTLSLQPLRPLRPAHQIFTLGGAASRSTDWIEYLGPMMPPEVAVAIAQGELNPFTRQPYDPDPMLEVLMKGAGGEVKDKTPSIHDEYESEQDSRSGSGSGSEKNLTGKRKHTN